MHLHSARRLTALAATAAVTTGLAACATDSGSSTNASDAAGSDTAETITINHALGTTEIKGTPKRVATVAWMNHEVPLALGVMPVGMSKATWGDEDGDGMMPWVKDKVAELGGDTPVLFDETDALPFEQIANTKPDVILASYSGITKEDYEQLSKIAPTVAYPEQAWGTNMEQMIELNSKAIGKEKEGKKLLEDLNKQVKDAFDAHPEFKDKKVMMSGFAGDDKPNMIGFYTSHDSRAGFLERAGFGVPDIVKKTSDKEKGFWAEISAENPDEFSDVDAIVAYGTGDKAKDEEILKGLQADPLRGRIPAIRDGHVVFLGNGTLASGANPSPLSIPYNLKEYFDAIAQALK